MQYWLVKSEPEDYSWQQFVQDGRAAWTGVRNYQARNNLRAMKGNDRVFFYHSVTGREVVGEARVVKEFYPDPTAREGEWSCVDLVPVQGFAQPVRLDQIKTDRILRAMPLVKQSRLSVSPVGAAQARRLLALGRAKPV
ncbi:MAG TPA: EVE domain-containing protein [Verrucomicrobiota bacterium]|nr:EVE domain-containing protein [Verrucomicrobiota bacterium]HNT14609.1 EVE domain-containing protein [Verrucomicrobiota bacterium]